MSGQCNEFVEGRMGPDIGPCLLPAGHSERMHRDESGREWYPTIAFPVMMSPALERAERLRLLLERAETLANSAAQAKSDCYEAGINPRTTPMSITNGEALARLLRDVVQQVMDDQQ